MWRMNGLWRRMAGVLVLCALLLSSEVMCENESAANSTSTVTNAANATTVSNTTADPGAGIASAGDSTTSTPPGSPVTSGNSSAFNIVIQNADPSDASGNTAAIIIGDGSNMKPDVKCVGKDDIQESNAIRVGLDTGDCEATKRIILEANNTGLCSKKICNLDIFQDGNTMLLASDDVELQTLAEALQSGPLKDQLGVTKTETPSSSGGHSVFWGILVTGLLAALAFTVGYLKCQRRSDTKGVRLAEEAYPVDQENQGNTLVSVAPLNPPAETQEKPSVNGESPEAAKPEPPPPTNGHSTTKTADTEL